MAKKYIRKYKIEDRKIRGPHKRRKVKPGQVWINKTGRVIYHILNIVEKNNYFGDVYVIYIRKSPRRVSIKLKTYKQFSEYVATFKYRLN